MVGRSCKWAENGEKGEDYDTLNLTFILQVDNYFVVGTFFPNQEKHLFSWKVSREKVCEFLIWCQEARLFQTLQIVLSVWGLLGNYYFFLFVYFIHLFYSIPQIQLFLQYPKSDQKKTLFLLCTNLFHQTKNLKDLLIYVWACVFATYNLSNSMSIINSFTNVKVRIFLFCFYDLSRKNQNPYLMQRNIFGIWSRTVCFTVICYIAEKDDNTDVSKYNPLIFCSFHYPKCRVRKSQKRLSWIFWLFTLIRKKVKNSSLSSSSATSWLSGLRPKGPRFGKTTFGWVSCNIDTFVLLVEHWTLLSSLSYNQAYVPGPRFGSKTS